MASVLAGAFLALAHSPVLVAAIEHEGCHDATCADDQSLLQLIGKVSQVAPQAKAWLGNAIEVNQQDYWQPPRFEGKSIFNVDTIPDSCFQDQQCATGAFVKYTTFSDVESWGTFYAQQFSGSVSGGYEGFTGTVSGSLGSSEDYSGTSELRLSYAYEVHLLKCFVLDKNKCLYNQSLMSSEFLDSLKALPTGSYSDDNMRRWKESFIEKYGTHVTIGSRHGAKSQALARVDKRSSENSACQNSSLCVTAGWIQAGNLSASTCDSSQSCDSSSSETLKSKSTCSALGGVTTMQGQVCQQNVDRETVNQWINGGDLDSGSSIFELDFKFIPALLRELNYEEWDDIATTMEKATEYSNCLINQDPPIQQWSAERGCECVRNCHNGGHLDPTTCTCNCRGNAKHGWKDSRCDGTYGSCQPGVNTGNPSSANKCPSDGSCSSWSSSKTCGDTEVCCASDFGTTCCSYGDTCDCDSWGCSCSR